MRSCHSPQDSRQCNKFTPGVPVYLAVSGAVAARVGGLAGMRTCTRACTHPRGRCRHFRKRSSRARSSRGASISAGCRLGVLPTMATTQVLVEAAMRSRLRMQEEIAISFSSSLHGFRTHSILHRHKKRMRAQPGSVRHTPHIWKLMLLLGRLYWQPLEPGCAPPALVNVRRKFSVNKS